MSIISGSALSHYQATCATVVPTRPPRWLSKVKVMLPDLTPAAIRVAAVWLEGVTTAVDLLQISIMWAMVTKGWFGASLGVILISCSIVNIRFNRSINPMRSTFSANSYPRSKSVGTLTWSMASLLLIFVSPLYSSGVISPQYHDPGSPWVWLKYLIWLNSLDSG